MQVEEPQNPQKEPSLESTGVQPEATAQVHNTTGTDNTSLLWEKAKIKIRAISSFMSIPAKKKAVSVSAPLPSVVVPRVQQDKIIEQSAIETEVSLYEKQQESNGVAIEDKVVLEDVVEISAKITVEEVKKNAENEKSSSEESNDSESSKQENDDQQKQSENESDFETESEEEDNAQKDKADDSDDDDDEDDDDEDDDDEEEEEEEDPAKKTIREAEDSLFKPETIKVDDKPCVEDDSTSKSPAASTKSESQGVKINLLEDNQVIRIDFHGREYTIDLRNEQVQANSKLVRIVNEITDLIELGQTKQVRDAPPELTSLAPFNYLTAVEYYLMKALHEMQAATRGKWQDEICCICQCDLFEEIDSYTHEKFIEQLNNSSDDDPVNLYQCEAHFFHRSCLKSMLTNSFVKCPVCCKIYGMMIGDQPPGKMRVYLDKHTRCDGYPDNSTIVIEMQMYQTTAKNGHYVPSTSRVGFLPNTAEARRVLEMIKTAFKRKLIFTIGRSVTTGQDNRIVWNGVHFKTDTCGGSANFGYPDPTYLQRVTQELALKGIYPPTNEIEVEKKSE